MLGTKILEERLSKFNGKLRVVKTWGTGTYIQSGGLTQSGGVVESIWKSTLGKIKNMRPEIKNVLILGLGGGTVAKLIRKKWPDAKITGVDIDPVIVELGKKYLGLNENEVDIKIQDAGRKVNGKFDLVIVDLYQGDKFPEKFDTQKFTRYVNNLLSNSGTAIFNRLYYKNKKEEAGEFSEKVKKVFKKVDYYYPVANLMIFGYRKGT